MKLEYTPEDLRQSGVYEILNLQNGKRYIGSAARSFRLRWNLHRHRLREGTHHNPYLQLAWNKHGESSFVFRIVEVTPPEYAVAQEQVFIDWRKSSEREFGYNLAPIAGSTRGVTASAETRAKLSITSRNISDETRAKLSYAASNISDETREKIRASSTGRRHTVEARTKISESHKGKKKSQEHCAKMAINGANISDETREKMAAAKRGRRLSLETRQKMSDSQYRRWGAKQPNDACNC